MSEESNYNFFKESVKGAIWLGVMSGDLPEMSQELQDKIAAWLASESVGGFPKSPKVASEESPDKGHTFRIVFESRGSFKVGDSDYIQEADWFGPPHQIEVRAWNLRDALLKAAMLPFNVQMGTQSQLIRVEPGTCPKCRGIGSDPVMGNDVPCSSCGGSGKVRE